MDDIKIFLVSQKLHKDSLEFIPKYLTFSLESAEKYISSFCDNKLTSIITFNYSELDLFIPFKEQFYNEHLPPEIPTATEAKRLTDDYKLAEIEMDIYKWKVDISSKIYHSIKNGRYSCFISMNEPINTFRLQTFKNTIYDYVAKYGYKVTSTGPDSGFYSSYLISW